VPDDAYAAIHLEGCTPHSAACASHPRSARVLDATYLAMPRNACVPLDVTPDGGPTIRRIGSPSTGRCSGTHALRGLSR